MTNSRNHFPAAQEPAPVVGRSLGLSFGLTFGLLLALVFLGAGTGAAEQPPRDPGGGAVAPCPDPPTQGCEPETPPRLRGFYMSVGGGGDYLFNNDRLGLDEAGAAGAAVGYARGPLRFELEFLARSTGEGSHGDLNAGMSSFRGGGFPRFPGAWAFGPEQAEVEAAQLFVNFYYDFHNSSRFTPWIGAGGGWATAEMEYAAGGGGWFPAIRDLPGRAKPGRDGFPRWGGLGAAEFEVSDTVPGMQLLAGLDIALGRRLSIEARARWSHFGQVRWEDAYDDGFGGWSFARSFPEDGPLFGGAFPGGAPPLDLSSVGATFALKYRF